MPRIQFNDVTPPDKRSIRNVPIPTGGKRKAPIFIKPIKEPTTTFVSNSPEPEVVENKKESIYEYYYPKSKETNIRNNNYGIGSRHKLNKKWLFGTGIIVVVAVFIVVMMTVFASASIDIIPKNQDLEVSMKIIGANEIEKNSVRYEIVKLTKTKTASVPATGEEAVELKASGKITIFNNFSSQPQRLITRTRFETKEGLIYRISESIVVPGKTIKNGAETPGSIEVEVFADEPGEKYNIKKTDFTIPGFKNDTGRYRNFYARSSTEMAGGFVGKMKTVSPSEKQTALQNIDSEIQIDLEKELQSKVPEELVLLSGSIIYKPKELPSKEESSSVLLSKETTAYALMLNKKDLSEKIISEYISSSTDWNNLKSEIIDFSALNITELPSNLENGGKIDLQIKGKTKTWAIVNTDIISQKLLDQPKNELQKIMNEFPGISSATASVRPIWKQNFPKDPSKVHLKTVTNE